MDVSLFDHPKYEEVVFWIENAQEALEMDPEDTLHQFTRIPLSSGIGWVDEVPRVYADPVDYIESLMKLEIRQVLMRAAENNLRASEDYDAYMGSFNHWDSIDAYATISLAQILAEKEPFFDCKIRVRLNPVCKKMGVTFEKLEGGS